MLGMASVHGRLARLAAANPRTSSVSQIVRGCHVETCSQESFIQGEANQAIELNWPLGFGVSTFVEIQASKH